MEKETEEGGLDAKEEKEEEEEVIMSDVVNKTLNREISLFKQSLERMEERMEKIRMLYKFNKLKEVV